MNKRDPLRTPFPNIPPEMDAKEDGVPAWEPAPAEVPPCPNCGAKVCLIRCPVTHPLIRTGKGTSTYMGCPACPWASPAIVTSGR